MCMRNYHFPKPCAGGLDSGMRGRLREGVPICRLTLVHPPQTLSIGLSPSIPTIPHHPHAVRLTVHPTPQTAAKSDNQLISHIVNSP